MYDQKDDSIEMRPNRRVAITIGSELSAYLYRQERPVGFNENEVKGRMEISFCGLDNGISSSL